MGLKIIIPKETQPGEHRVAASVETVKKLCALGCIVMLEKDAGLKAAIPDSAYIEAGGIIAKGHKDLYTSADIVLKVQAPNKDEMALIPKGALLIALLSPHSNSDLPAKFAKAGINAFAMELVPRISRAQSMDALSSQSNLSGYKAVLDATEYYPHAFPMMMTAAGTIPPAKVFVMGAGVAGLQAIATARRLGAVVTATDVRPAAKEQVASLGANFIAVEDEEFKQAETAGGYAKEMSESYKKKQAELVEAHIAKQDIVITTALIPGRPAPKLISEDMVKSMKTGSVIVDLAVETGGNCEISKCGEVIEKHGVTIVGHQNTPSRLAADSSALYAKNLLNLLKLIIDEEDIKLAINWDDEIIKGVAISKDGAVIHPLFQNVKASAQKKTSSTKATTKKTTTKKSSTTKTKKATATKSKSTSKKTKKDS